MKNELNHNRTLSNLRTEVCYARAERRWVGRGSKHARVASKRYNKAFRKAAKQQLKKAIAA